MATFQTYNGDGSTTAFTFSAPYINSSDIKAEIGGVATTAFTVSGSTVTFSTAPAAGTNNVRIFRETNNTTIDANFQSGSALRAVDFNDNFTQLLFVSQESKDTADTADSKSDIAVTAATNATTSANSAVSSANSAVTTANTASANATTAVNTANAATTTANSATTTANTALSTANTADTNATTAVNTANAATTTANTASSNATSAVSTANIASSTAGTANTNASTAVSTANSASTAATNAVNTANSAATDAATAISTANSAVSTANGAVTTANSAAADATTAVTTANGAVTTANTATTTANNASTTATTADTNASAAVTTANAATATANAAAATVASAVFYTPVANFASFPSSPSNQDRIEVNDSTGLQSQSIVTGIPSGFTGSNDLTMRLQYNSSTSKWEFQQYFAEDPEARYMPKQGGTMTGLLTLSGAPTANLHAATKAYVDAENTSQTSTINSSISTNTSNISTNATNIASNTTALGTKMATAGGTFSGAVSFDDDVVIKGDGTNGSGELTLNCENNSHGIKVKGPPHSAGANYTLTLPNDTGTNGQALTTNGSGVTSWSTIDLSTRLALSGGSMSGALTLSGAPTAANHAATKSYVDTEVSGLVDAAPGTLNTLNELAAALGDDANFSTTTANNIATKMPLAGGTFTGNVDHNDNVRARFGTGDDLQIYHDGFHSWIKDVGTGNLQIQANNFVLENTSGTNYLAAVSGAQISLYYNGSEKLYTKSDGVDITGELQCDSLDVDGAANISSTLYVGGETTFATHARWSDNDKALFGAGDDLQISHNGADSLIDNSGPGHLYIRNSTDDKHVIIQSDNGSGGVTQYIKCDGADGAVKLSHYGSQKIVTTSSGIDVTGSVTADSYRIDQLSTLP